MNQTKITIVLLLGLLGVIAINSAAYTVDERERAIVVRLGEVTRTDDTPGLKWKLPVVEDVHFFDSRILTLDAPPQRFLTKEKKSVVVDSFVKWRITDTLKYYLSMSGDEERARIRLETLVNSGLRDEFGKRLLHDVVSGDRAKIMEILTANMKETAREFGIDVIDVRLQRVDLPQEVSQSVYRRMEAERTRIAKELRAQGEEKAEKIKADAERQSSILKAEAYRDAERTRGQGDARATAIYAKAYKRNPEFYALYRSLNAYKESFKDKNDIMIIDPSSDFFKYMKKPRRK